MNKIYLKKKKTTLSTPIKNTITRSISAKISEKNGDLFVHFVHLETITDGLVYISNDMFG